jgi:hypothetical protein
MDRLGADTAGLLPAPNLCRRYRLTHLPRNIGLSGSLAIAFIGGQDSDGLITAIAHHLSATDRPDRGARGLDPRWETAPPARHRMHLERGRRRLCWHYGRRPVDPAHRVDALRVGPRAEWRI